MVLRAIVSYAPSRLFGFMLCGILIPLITPPQCEAQQWHLQSLGSFSDAGIPTKYIGLDNQGNLYGVRPTSDGTGERIWELDRGTNHINTLATVADNRLTGFAVDGAGNVYLSNGSSASEIGTISELSKGSNTVSTIYTFAVGSGPWGPQSLITDVQGNLYGETFGGGVSSTGSNFGTVFKFSANTHQYSNLALAVNPYYSVGADPRGQLVLDNTGNLIGGLAQGGPYGGLQGYGSIFKVNAAFTEITGVAPFSFDHGMNVVGLAVDGSQNIIGVSEQNGAGQPGRLFEVNHGSSNISLLQSFPGYMGFSAPATNASGDVFVSSSANGTISELANGATSLSTIYTFDASSFGAYSPLGLVASKEGDLYGVSYGGTTGNGEVFRLTQTAVPEPGAILSLCIGMSFAIAYVASYRKKIREQGLI